MSYQRYMNIMLIINISIFISALPFLVFEQNFVFHQARSCQVNEKQESGLSLCHIE